MKTTAITFLLFFLCVGANAQTPDRSFTPTNTNSEGNGRRLALVIGNGNYNFVSKLNNPLNDANSMAKALRTMGFEVKTSTNANRQNLKEAINEWGKSLRANDIALFYYAGHALEVDGVNYLCPTDANPLNAKQVEYETTPINLIMGWMESQRTQTNIILLDACRDNPFKSLFRTVGEEGGLSSMKAPSGTFIGFAASPGKKSSDGDGSNGLYTEAILAAINTPNKTIDQIFNSVNAQVRKRSNGSQIPFKSSSLEADFYFSVNKNEVAPKNESKKEITTTLSIDEILKNGNDFLDKKEYVQAKYWYEKGVELNNSSATDRLGRLYHNGQGVERNILKAKEYYEKAAELGLTSSMISLGDIYHYGAKDVSKDFEKAVEWYKKAAQKNDGEAMCRLGNLYQGGHGFSAYEDIKQVELWYNKAISIDYLKGYLDLATFYVMNAEKRDFLKAKNLFYKASDKGAYSYWYGFMLIKGGFGIEKDEFLGNQILEKVVQKDPSQAYNIGLRYCGLGNDIIERDLIKAMYWYQKGCELGSTSACKSLKQLKSGG